ncbi:MAG: hypothetical protein CO108_23310 [Deltaproteobacteria bacterium CG_4_9_14_3_um_filter_63_12]|nr:MAG: hypothetical protein COW42_14460 [Deltaproteobacteria bacterium CG17_big_fil_post_rev_8_21_14_2_50_63_7]PJB36466.1 MAG: hypothetical protein CO108_23310 [Deltaproteobacteria bacterium CG_4_9_14_3_um_filter_63_12]
MNASAPLSSAIDSSVASVRSKPATTPCSASQTPTRLPEFRHYHPAPGHPDWVTLQREAKAIADEVRPQLERPQRGLPELKRRKRSYQTAASNFLENRRRTQSGREDLLPLYFIWTTLRACNFRCTYCDDHQGHKYPNLSNAGMLDTEGGKRLLDVMRTRTPSVYFAGGEPMIRKDLPELTRHARDTGYFPVVINTNGSLLERRLRDASWRTWLADTDVIVVSLDALDLQRLSSLWVSKQPGDVLRNLLVLRELAKEMRVKLMVNTVIQPDTVAEASHVLDFANDMGIWFCAVPVNVGPTVHGGLHAQKDYQRLVEKLLERKRGAARIAGSLRMNERLLRSEPLNCRNTLKPHVDFDGKLIWPCKASVNVEPVSIDVTAFDGVDALWAHASSLVEPTRFHGPASNQCGANCNWAQNYTTDTYAHGLEHPLSLLREVVEFLGA